MRTQEGLATGAPLWVNDLCQDRGVDWKLAVLTPLLGLVGAFLGSVLGPGVNDRRTLAMRLLKSQEDAYIDALTYADRAPRLIDRATNLLEKLRALPEEEVDLAPAHALGARLRLYADKDVRTAWDEFRRADQVLQDYLAIYAPGVPAYLPRDAEQLEKLEAAAKKLTDACRKSLRTRSGRWRRPWW